MRSRRRFLAALAGAAGGAWFPGLIRAALAMGGRFFPIGIQKLEGDVRINGKPAGLKDPVNPGDLVETGPDAMAVFVIGRDVLLVRGGTKLRISEQENPYGAERIFSILHGKVLSVFGRGRRTIISATAVMGIRGSAAYVEAEADLTYVCTCYGTGELASSARPDAPETVRTRHHEAPRFIRASGDGPLIETAPVFNHTDAELIMLEAILGRRPPFVEDPGYSPGKGSY